MYALEQLLLFLFSPCLAISAETWKSAWDNKSQPSKPTELRNFTCVTCKIVAFLPKKNYQSCPRKYWFEVHNCYIFKAISVPRFICLLDGFFPTFFPLWVYKKKGKLVNKSDETVIRESYLCEVSHICTFTMKMHVHIGLFKWKSNSWSMC